MNRSFFEFSTVSAFETGRSGQTGKGGRLGRHRPQPRQPLPQHLQPLHADVGEGDAELAGGAAVAAFGGGGREHRAGEHEEGELADEEGAEGVGGEGVGVLDVGEVGAAAEDAPAGEGGEGGVGGVAAAEDFEALGGEPGVEVAQAPEGGALAGLGGADRGGVEDLLDLGEAGGGGDEGAGAVAGQAVGLREGVEVDQGVAPVGVGEEGVGAGLGGGEVAVGLVEDEGEAVRAGEGGEGGDGVGRVLGAGGVVGGDEDDGAGAGGEAGAGGLAGRGSWRRRRGGGWRRCPTCRGTSCG